MGEACSSASGGVVVPIQLGDTKPECCGNHREDAMGSLKVGGYVRTPVGSGSEVGTCKCGTRDIPRLEALHGR